MRRARAIACQINDTNDQIDEKEQQECMSQARGNNMSAERSTKRAISKNTTKQKSFRTPGKH
jgi:hypothetical protein